MTPREDRKALAAARADRRILTLWIVYLNGVAVASSINGLVMHATEGVSVVGPAYHGLFGAALILAGLLSATVRKSTALIATIFGAFGVIVVCQLLWGYASKPTHVLQLFKWCAPLFLFAVYRHWDYLRQPEARRRIARLFCTVPLIHTALIILSAITYFAFGFNPSLFPEGTLRFTGFTWGYNATVNVFFICAFMNFFVLNPGIGRKALYCLGFLLVNSKTAAAYFFFAGLSFVLPAWRKARRIRKLAIAAAGVPVIVAAALGGYALSLRASDASGYLTESGRPGDIETLTGALVGGRSEWYTFMIADVPEWPVSNLLIGNGYNIDRRKLNSLWWEMIGSQKYLDAPIDESDKAIELDILGHLDMLGLVGASLFAAIFYVWPFTIRQPLFRWYHAFLVALSLTAGHVINNPHSGTLLLFMCLFLKAQSPPAVPSAVTRRMTAARPATA